MKAVFLKILGFVIAIDLFYMSIGQWWLTQSEDHPPPELQIALDTDIDTLIGMGETLLKTKGGCLLCHKITEVGNERGPDLRGIGGRAASRKPNMSAEAYLTESLVDPGAYVVEEFATAGGASIMPIANQPPADLSPTELKALVAYLQSLGGEVTVEISAEDVRAAEARKQTAPISVANDHPGAAPLTAKGCMACHDLTGTTRRVGPPLSNVSERLSAAEIRQSIVDPNAVIAEGYPKDVMLKDFAAQLTSQELDQVVQYLSGETPLTARLNHPAVHLLALILLFNGGVFWAMRTIPVRDGEDSPDTQKRSWRTAGVLLGSCVVVGGLYLGFRDQPPERPVDPPTLVAGEPADERPAEKPAAVAAVEPIATAPDGKALFMRTCVACHGMDAKGLPGLGKDMTTSEFVRSTSDEALVEFIKKGRAVDDPTNTTGVPMPPYGANPTLTDPEILAIIEFIHSLSD